MVYLSVEQIRDFYDAIVSRSGQGSCSVLIFVANEVDSLCACKILVSLLKSDYVAFKVVPVNGYDDIARANESFIQGNDQIKTMIFLNCGGSLDLAEFLSLSQDMIAFVLDSHRPWNLFNIFTNDQIILLDDGEIEEEQENFLKAFESYQLEDMAENASSDLSDGDDDEVDDKDGDEDENEDVMKLKDHNIQSIPLPDLTRRQRKIRSRMARTALDLYYRENWRGSSISSMLYTIGLSMSKVTNDILWCGIVGTTSQYLLNEIDFERYSLEIEAFNAEWSRINNNPLSNDTQFEDNSGTGRMSIDNDNYDNSDANLNANANANANYTNTTNSSITANSTLSFEQSSRILLSRHGLEKFKDGRIFRELEYRFMLLRHWNLYESMMYTPFSATKLRIWSERGKQRLDTLLSKMGFPLSICREKYQTMDPAMKAIFSEKLGVFGDEYGLGDHTFESYCRQYGTTLTLSASDMVYALTSLLDAPVNLKKDSQKAQYSAVTATEDKSEDVWTSNFYYAFDALEIKQSSMLVKGIEMCKECQQTILQQGQLLILNKRITPLKGFYLVVLNQNTESLSHWFRYPKVLSKLGYFLMDALKETGRDRGLPFLVASFQKETNMYIVVGLTGAGEVGSNRSFLGNAFRQTAETIHADMKYDGFSSCTIHVHEQDLQPFLQTLQYMLLRIQRDHEERKENDLLLQDDTKLPTESDDEGEGESESDTEQQ